jgi:hypothetical protein
MQAKAEAVWVRHGIYEATHQILFLAHQFAVFASNWVDPVLSHFRIQQGGHFISKEPGAVH